MELVILMLIRSFREGDFELYWKSLAELLSYFFANNDVNYARWLTIHLRDMMSIGDNHPQVAEEFKKGRFVVHKSQRPFSGLVIDQAHKQKNGVIKDILSKLQKVNVCYKSKDIYEESIHYN